MTVGRAKAIISYVWLFISIVILGLVFYLTIIGKFQFRPGDWDAGLAWAIPLVLPILGFIIPTWTLSKTSRDRIVVQNIHVLVAALILSGCYFLSLFVVLWRLPQDIVDIEHYASQTLRTSSWVLGAFQALIVVALGKFFLEEIHPEHGAELPPDSHHEPDKKV